MEENEWIMYLEQAQILIDKGYVLDLDVKNWPKFSPKQKSRMTK